MVAEKFPLPRKTLRCCLALLLLGSGTVLAQVAIDNVDSATRELERQRKARELQESREEKVPELFEGEMEDLGPQYLLLRKPKWKHWDFYTDLQWYYTSNATLAENQGKSSDVTAWTAQLVFRPGKLENFAGGEAIPRFGGRLQTFRYGQVRGDDEVIRGVVIDFSDFNARTLFAEMQWRRGAWAATGGFRFSDLQSRSTDTSFYRENMLYWSASRTVELEPTRLLQFAYDGTYRVTKVDPFANRPSNWNDRTEHALMAMATLVYYERLILQPSVRTQWTEYIRTPRDRTDFVHSASMNVSYYFTPQISARVFMSGDMRESTEDNADYANYNMGLGTTFTLRF